MTGCNDDNKLIEIPDTIAQYDTADLSFFSHKTYNALTPWFNPFTQINIKLDLTSPSGHKFSVPGFYDGDGAGGLQGRTFKVRVCPDETGKWHWQLNSNLPKFDHLEGSLKG